jgi:hypothetical protein
LLAVKFSRLIIHSRVSAGGVVAQYVIEENERFDHPFPRRLFNLLQAVEWVVDRVRARAILQQSTPAFRNLLQQDQFHDGDQHPQLIHFEDRDPLEGLNVRREVLAAELAGV